MPLSEPPWWYGPPTLSNRLIAAGLSPVAALYTAATKRRFSRTVPWQAPVPVICVGNLTAGGTGKTPTARTIANLAIDAGHTPAFLTRGYTGKIKQPTWVDVDKQTAKDVGDEPLLLAADHPTCVARNRADGARKIIESNSAITLIIMDDGLQNPQLKKDFSIALIDGARGLGNARVIPSGPLRAPLDFQLPKVDLAIINGDQSTPTSPLPSTVETSNVPMGNMYVAPRRGLSINSSQAFLAFCGIGSPRAFYRTLAAEGLQVAETVSFPDHHTLTEAEAKSLLAKSEATNTQLVTTEKDFVRLDPANPTHAALRETTEVLFIDMKLDRKTEDVIRTRLTAMRSAR
ncbi:MAG: tetraacyldisaccharide 4'-kinase [Pseudomonadota bacterium]